MDKVSFFTHFFSKIAYGFGFGLGMASSFKIVDNPKIKNNIKH
jgi:hypothetical protein